MKGRKRNTDVVGDPINLPGLVYGPVNEQGVVFLFGLLAKDLGYQVECVQSRFPDCVARKKNSEGKWEKVKIEFEYRSSDFRRHEHDASSCDVIVCWEHDWGGCPPKIEVRELKKEINRFSTPPEPPDPDGPGRYHVLNTNITNIPQDHDRMVKEGCAIATGSGYKEKIERISKGDIVFLYQSQVGIVAFGTATGDLKKTRSSFIMPLKPFNRLTRSLSAQEIKKVCGVNYRFLPTLFSLDPDAGRKLLTVVRPWP